jgi:lipopolysaccharide cholinephosphotransferase
MNKLGIAEIQNIELKILEYVDSICSKNALRYGLTSGSVLGAIRHGGFIPWDDDVDIVMPRPDYERLISIMGKNNGRYHLSSPYTEPDYIYEYSKMMDMNTVLIEDPNGKKIQTHIYIDIFPVDGVPDSRKARRKQYIKVNRIKKIYAVKNRLPYKIRETQGRKKVLYSLGNVLLKPFSKSKIMRSLDNVCKKYDFDSSNYAAVITGQGEKEVLKTSEYQLDGIVQFEGKKFHTYKNPEKYLRQFFGNYMQLPPENERHGHDSIAYLREK